MARGSSRPSPSAPRSLTVALAAAVAVLCLAPGALRAQGIAGPEGSMPSAVTGGSIEPSDLQRRKEMEKEKEAARRAALISPLPVDVLAVPFPISGAIDDQVALLVEIGGKELLANNDGAVEGQIDASIAPASGGGVVDQFTQPFALDATDEKLQAGGLKLYGVLRVNPGDYKVHVQVADKAGAKGSREVTVHAPDFARKEAVLSPPLFPDAPDRWRVFQQSDSPHADLPFPFVDGQGGGFLPSASPVIGPDGGGAVVYAYGAAGDAPKLSAKLIGEKAAATAPKVTLVESGQGKFTIQRRLLLRVEGPLPEGAQRLELAVATPDATRTTTTALAVRAQAAAQAELKAGEQPMEQEPVDEAPALAPGWTKADLSAKYREVLTRAAAGELDPAVHQLADLEVAATPGHKNGELKALREVERESIEAQRVGLLPVAYLHTRLDDELRQRGETWMIAQNRIWIADLMERWVKTSSDAGSKHVAAQLLAGVGSSKEALEYEPGNALALLRLAISAEKTGRLPEAADALKKLLQAHPDDPQGRLRLAIVTRRQGDEKNAARMLGDLIADNKVPKWVSSLAVQQLAEVQRDLGQEQVAESVLRQGIDKIGTQALYLQLAFYLDERQKADEAVQVLNGMPVSSGPEQVSGRFLYNEPPRAEIGMARQQVETRVVGEWPSLRASLAAGGQLAGSR